MRTVLAVAAVCLAALAGCTSDGLGAGSHSALTLQIRLSQTSVPAGHPIQGVAVVTNRNPQQLLIGTCNHVWLQVGLVNGKVSFDPAWDLCRDRAGTAVQPGTTKMPITIQTTYEQCTPHARYVTEQTPACVNGHMPALPPGIYTTKSVALSPEGARVIAAPPITVTLTT
jgi:hypothetical protein